MRDFVRRAPLVVVILSVGFGATRALIACTEPSQHGMGVGPDPTTVKVGSVDQSLVAHTLTDGGAPDIWSGDQALRLTYCVSTTFGAEHARVVNDMASAAGSWEAAGNVNFRYVSSLNSSCNSSANVTFAVVTWRQGTAPNFDPGAVSFYPTAPSYGSPVVRGLLQVNEVSVDSGLAGAANIRLVGVLRHELGHILGMTHEHLRPESGSLGMWDCNQEPGGEHSPAPTAYDSNSVMHRPWCNGNMNSDWSLSVLDKAGIHAYYPFDFGHVLQEGARNVSGDTRGDVCGRHAFGVYCGTSTGSAFSPSSLWSTAFADSAGWDDSQAHFLTIRYPDLNNDGRADICGRTVNGVECATSTGTGFGSLSVWASEFSNANGWDAHASYYSSIRFPDLDNNGRPDICGRSPTGIYCRLNFGGLGAWTQWDNNLTDANGWLEGPEYWSTISYPDVSGDGKADLCARAPAGIYCRVTNAAGTAFGTWQLWSSAFANAPANWETSPGFYSTIRYVDLDGDGDADVCGRSASGIVCGLSNGSTGFSTPTLWQAALSNGAGWDFPEYYSTIAFVDVGGDSKPDLCARDSLGIICGINTGTSFGTMTRWNSTLTNAAGWNVVSRYSTIRFADVTGDGKADLCALGSGGVVCGASNGSSSFATPTTWESTNFVSSFSTNWSLPAYYTTFRVR